MINENIQHEMFLDRPLTNTVTILPPQLTFNSEKISSITPYIKEIKYSPNTGLTYTGNNTMKFLLNSTGFIDPYGTYISLEVENNSDRPIQFDNSAHSLISSIIISSNGNVIEEINDYDVICSVLFDSTLNSDARKKYKNICFGDGTDLGSEGTNETILYDKGTADMKILSDINNGNGDPTVKKSWFELLYSSSRVKNNTISKFTNTQVIKGKIKRWEPQTKMTILLPLMSNVFGFGLSLQNYKWIPLEIFPNLEFSITLNPHAFFTPLPYNINNSGLDENIKNDIIKNSEYDISIIPTTNINNFGENDDQANTVVNKFTNLIGIKDSNSLRSYKINNPRLITTQLFFDSSILSVIRDMALKSGFVLETQLIQSFQQKYFKQHPENTYVLNVPRKSVRSVISIFLNKVYEKCSLCRKLKRYSRGVKKFQVKIGEDYYPYNPIEGDASSNCCLENNSSFLNSWEKVFYKTNSNFGDSIINNFNFAIDIHKSDILYKYLSDTTPSNKTKLYNILTYYGKPYAIGGNVVTHNYPNIEESFLNEKVGRAIFAVSLDQIPMSGNIYKSGVDTRYTKPILLEMYCNDIDGDNINSVGGNVYVQYVMLEYDYTIKIGYNGFIVKEF